MQTHTRATDLIARLGGDEFIILLPEVAVEKAKIIISRLENELLQEIQKPQWSAVYGI